VVGVWNWFWEWVVATCGAARAGTSFWWLGAPPHHTTTQHHTPTPQTHHPPHSPTPTLVVVGICAFYLLEACSFCLCVVLWFVFVRSLGLVGLHRYTQTRHAQKAHLIGCCVFIGDGGSQSGISVVFALRLVWGWGFGFLW